MIGEPPLVDPDLLMQAHILAFKEDHERMPPLIYVTFEMFFALMDGGYLDSREDDSALNGPNENETHGEYFTYRNIDLQFTTQAGWMIRSPIDATAPIDWEAVCLTGHE